MSTHPSDALIFDLVRSVFPTRGHTNHSGLQELLPGAGSLGTVSSPLPLHFALFPKTSSHSPTPPFSKTAHLNIPPFYSVTLLQADTKITCPFLPLSFICVTFCCLASQPGGSPQGSLHMVFLGTKFVVAPFQEGRLWCGCGCASAFGHRINPHFKWGITIKTKAGLSWAPFW